jgi:uncharacterized membrane protein YraQ (UPF0718 family)
MKMLLFVTIAAVSVSLVKDRERTWQGLKKGLTMFLNLLPSLLNVLMLVAIVLSLVPQSRIVALLGKEGGIGGYTIAAIIGSISLIPGFIAYPLCGILVKTGINPGVIAVFVTTLMMVGILTLPLEIKYFGARTALLRNGLSFVGAILVGLIMAVIL